MSEISEARAFLLGLSRDVVDDGSRWVLRIGLSLAADPALTEAAADALGRWTDSELDLHAQGNDLPIM